MPVNPVVPNCAEMRVHFNLPNAEEMVNVHNLNIGATPLDGTFANTLMAAYITAYNAHLVTHVSTFVTLNSLVTTDLRTANGPSYENAYAIAGTGSGAPLPSQIAATIKWKTALRGRSFQGRTYLGGFTEAGSAGQSPEAAVITAIQDFADDLISGFAAAGGDLAVVSRYELDPLAVPPAPRSVPRATNLITDVVTGTAGVSWHTQRRRAI